MAFGGQQSSLAVVAERLMERWGRSVSMFEPISAGSGLRALGLVLLEKGWKICSLRAVEMQLTFQSHVVWAAAGYADTGAVG